MKKQEISHKDLSKKQLENLKDIYIAQRICAMSEKDLREFVQITITDQIKGTVGNEEEKEVWKEIKDYFTDGFEKILKEVLQENEPLDGELNSKKKDLEERLELLEQRKKENSNLNEDMW